MPAPPMRDSIKLFSPVLDDNGNPETDRYGKPKVSESTTKARVQYTTSIDMSQRGINFEPILVIDLPSSTKVKKGDGMEWVDRFGDTVKDTVEGVEEVLSYSGLKVYWRIAYVGKAPSG